jgi:hypothetical protein
MAFRADEAASAGYAAAEAYLVPRSLHDDESERAKSRRKLSELVESLGPAVEAYPSWHPLVRNHDDRYPQTWPNSETGYRGLDHTRCFVNGFITCPYTDGQDIIDSVNELPYHHAFAITAKRLDFPLYQSNATPILVRCEWIKRLELGGTIPLSVALPLLLEMELPTWKRSQLAETWDTMRPYFLGCPHGSRSSLFLSQESGQSIKKIWNEIINTGMFGPIKVGRA